LKLIRALFHKQNDKARIVMLNKQFRPVIVHVANMLCKMALLHALRSSIADKYFCSRHQLTDIFWTKLLWERSDTFPVTFRRQLKGRNTAGNGERKVSSAWNEVTSSTLNRRPTNRARNYAAGSCEYRRHEYFTAGFRKRMRPRGT